MSSRVSKLTLPVNAEEAALVRPAATDQRVPFAALDEFGSKLGTPDSTMSRVHRAAYATMLSLGLTLAQAGRLDAVVGVDGASVVFKGFGEYGDIPLPPLAVKTQCDLRQNVQRKPVKTEPGKPEPVNHDKEARMAVHAARAAKGLALFEEAVVPLAEEIGPARKLAAAREKLERTAEAALLRRRRN